MILGIQPATLRPVFRGRAAASSIKPWTGLLRLASSAWGRTKKTAPPKEVTEIEGQKTLPFNPRSVFLGRNDVVELIMSGCKIGWPPRKRVKIKRWPLKKFGQRLKRKVYEVYSLPSTKCFQGDMFIFGGVRIFLMTTFRIIYYFLLKLHPRKQTWNLKYPLGKGETSTQTTIFGVPAASFRGCFFFCTVPQFFWGGYLPPRASPNVENGQLGLRENGRNPLSVEISENRVRQNIREIFPCQTFFFRRMFWSIKSINMYIYICIYIYLYPL